jgi:hypothetical protein
MFAAGESTVEPLFKLRSHSHSHRPSRRGGP